jgi:hypothetical protein
MPLDLLLGAQPADDSSRSGLRIAQTIESGCAVASWL